LKDLVTISKKQKKQNNKTEADPPYPSIGLRRIHQTNLLHSVNTFKVPTNEKDGNNASN